MLVLARLLDRHEQQQARQQAVQVTYQAPTAGRGLALQGAAAQQHPVTVLARPSSLEASRRDRVDTLREALDSVHPHTAASFGAAPCDQCALLRLLLGRGADSQTALIMAAEAGNAAVIPALVAAGVDVRFEHGHRALAAAVSWCNVAAVAALLAAGVDVDTFVRTVWKGQYQTRAITWVEVNAVMLVAAGADVQSNTGLSKLVALAAFEDVNWEATRALSALESYAASYAGTPAHAEAVAQAAAAQERITALLQQKEEQARQHALCETPPTVHHSAAPCDCDRCAVWQCKRWGWG